MDNFTDSLNSQMQMLGLDNNNYINNNDNNNNQITIKQHTNEPISNLTLQVKNNLTMKLINSKNEQQNLNNLPNDIESLNHMCLMRMKYTKPKNGGNWEFDKFPTTISALKDTILFMEKNSINENDYNYYYNNEEIDKRSTPYDRYLKNLEISPEKLDSEFHFRFENYQPFLAIVNNLIMIIKSSKYSHLIKLLESPRYQGKDIPNDWKIYPNNLSLTQNDYVKYYDIMELNLRKWLIDYCIVNNDTKYIFLMNENLTSYEILNLIINQQDRSFQLYSLANLIIENNKGEEFLNKNSGFLPYLTYISILQDTIILSLPESKNPFKTMMLLTNIIRGMKPFIKLKREFFPKIADFISKYPDFTLGHLVTYLKDNNMPEIDGILKISD